MKYLINLKEKPLPKKSLRQYQFEIIPTALSDNRIKVNGGALLCQGNRMKIELQARKDWNLCGNSDFALAGYDGIGRGVLRPDRCPVGLQCLSHTSCGQPDGPEGGDDHHYGAF